MMNVRTDLAIESREMYLQRCKEELEGVRVEQEEYDEIKVTAIEVLNENGSIKLEKPVGNYITIEMPQVEDLGPEVREKCCRVIAAEIGKLISVHQDSKIMIVGLGNHNITPDALGPKTAANILVTRHRFLILDKEDNKNLTNVSVITPGVMGNTGIESVDMIKGIVDEIKPDVIIAIDALAARNVNRVTTTIQMSDTGVSPGAGVGNHRRGINQDTLGVKVIAIGVPTVITAASIVYDFLAGYPEKSPHHDKAKEILEHLPGDMIVTPGNIDAVIQEFSRILAGGINQAIHPNLSPKEIRDYLN